METQILLRAANFAAHKHRLQKRKDKDQTPYINHPLEVSNFLSQAGVVDIDTLVAGLLHDTIEDTDTKIDEIVEFFGENVANIVMECTDNKSLPKVQRKKLQIEHAEHISIPAKLVKMADKYSNLKDLKTNPPQSWTAAEINGYANWSYAVFLKLRGHNKQLDQKLTELFDSFGISNINSDELDERLNHYYECLKN